MTIPAWAKEAQVLQPIGAGQLSACARVKNECGNILGATAS